MASADSRVTIHIAARLDGFIARKDGRVDWLETADEFAGGKDARSGIVRFPGLGLAGAVVRSWPFSSETPVRRPVLIEGCDDPQ